jgi:class 3 adenylate cyclase
MSNFRHHVFAYADIEGSSRLSVPEKERVQNDLRTMLDQALVKAGVEKVDWSDRGDGCLLVSLTPVPVREVIEYCATTIDQSIAARTVGDVRLRIRLIIHQGDILHGEHGWRGPALDRAARMLDAVEVKDALKARPDGRMALVVAPELYDSVVRGYLAPDPTTFRKRRLDTKEGELEAWLTITGAAAQPGRDADEEAVPAPGPALPSQTFNNVRKAKKSVIAGAVNGGIRYGTERTGE